MTPLAAPTWDIYSGIPVGLRWLFFLELFLVGAATIWLVVLFVRALAVRRSWTPARLDRSVPDDLLWIFLVPALNEEVTIADSVGRLAALNVPNRIILVVDDGSTDATAQLLAGLDQPGLSVLRRDPPDARQGKAAALNYGWRFIHREILGTRPEATATQEAVGVPTGTTDGDRGRYAGWDPRRVVVVVVDADGRLHPQSPAAVAGHLDDPRVGGVQTLVRIYNRHTVLTWCQDVEFTIYGRLFQLGRSPWGTAGMGGNGQFNRLAALDAVADQTGPWRDKLTEDQDLGLRLVAAGWHNRQESRVGVDQQGVSNLRRLLRQRTRWAQGGLQAMRLLRVVGRADVAPPARFDLFYYLLTPIIQLIVSAALVASVVLFFVGWVPLWGGAIWLFFFFYAISFGSAVLGLVCRAPRITPYAVLKAAVLSLPYTVYAWLVIPALLGALYRTVTAKTSWAKTIREPIAAEPG